MKVPVVVELCSGRLDEGEARAARAGPPERWNDCGGDSGELWRPVNLGPVRPSRRHGRRAKLAASRLGGCQRQKSKVHDQTRGRARQAGCSLAGPGPNATSRLARRFSVEFGRPKRSDRIKFVQKRKGGRENLPLAI